MGWALGTAVFFVIWWIMLFAVLPFGIQSQHEVKDIVPGSEPGAPAKPRLLRKVLINTLVAIVVWVIVDYVYINYYLQP